MKKFVFLLLAVLLAGCSAPTPLPIFPTPTSLAATPVASPSQSTTSVGIPASGAGTPTVTATQAGTRAPPALDPLTGLTVSNGALLNRRPLIVKVENLPRADRPQHGLTAADLVYEYYTEEGTTRFIAVYYGTDAARVGPIRSARFFDANVIQMYKGIFAFGSAYAGVLDRFRAAPFANRLIVETPTDCPPMCRFDPNGKNILVTNTSQLSQYATQKGIDNGRQDLSGMTFAAEAPAGGQASQHVTVHYSAAIYNRWDYDAANGRYLRFVDQDNAGSPAQEKYVQLVDAENNQPIGAQNLVVLFVDHQYIAKTPVEVFDMNLMGSGTAYVARDGQVYKGKWQRTSPDAVLQLTDASGKPFPLKPGQTWFEVLSLQSTVTQDQQGWRFNFILPPK